MLAGSLKSNKEAFTQVAAQRRAQSMSVQPVGLDLGIGNEPCLVRMGQHYFLNLRKLLELVMHQTPVPVRFHHRLAWTFQTGEKFSFCSLRTGEPLSFYLTPSVFLNR
jgi:hypothetical protein